MDLCEESKVKYAEFEEKIQKLEKKVLGSISHDYFMDAEKMFMLFQKFVDDENLYSDQMLYFIRAEHLNLINLRKEFVKNAKQ